LLLEARFALTITLMLLAIACAFKLTDKRHVHIAYETITTHKQTSQCQKHHSTSYITSGTRELPRIGCSMHVHWTYPLDTLQ